VGTDQEQQSSFQRKLESPFFSAMASEKAAGFQLSLE
jgi:hypothetical protein